MWKCHKCGKPVYFAERKQSLGYDWHPECLRCEECGKILNPGQHAEHKGIPYCNVPCYSVLFGPTLFGHGSQVESHKSFGKSGKPTPSLDRNRLEAKLKLYNQYYESKSWQLTSKERNGKLILEGVLRIYWGVRKTIHLQEDDDVIKALRLKQNTKSADFTENDQKYQTLPLRIKLDNPVIVVDKAEDEPRASESAAAEKSNDTDTAETITITDDEDDTSLPKSRQSIDLSRVRIRKLTSSRSRIKLKRRCSINGHFYNRETSIFTPPYGSASNVWVTSLVNAPEVINLLLDKFRVENNPTDFALYVVWDSGETRQIQDLENPLLVRVLLGPHEDVAKVFIMDKNHTNEISNKVAQYLNLQEPELHAILRKFDEEEQREISQIQHKYRAMRRYIHSCLKSKSVPISAQP